MSQQVCQGGATLIFACSGAADVGAIADQSARQMTRDGLGQMFCLTGVGGNVEPIMNKTRSASTILAIDGCGLDCVKLCLEKAGIRSFKHMRVTDLGLEKGKTPPTQQTLQTVVDKGREILE